MGAREFKERLLIELSRAANRLGPNRYLDPEKVAKIAGLTWEPGHLRRAVNGLRDSGLITASATIGAGPDGGMSVQVLQYGVEEAEDLVEKNFEYEEFRDADTAIPASNRYVTLDDNQRLAANDQLLALRKAVTGDNEGSEEDRIIALSEIAAFESTVTQPRVSHDLIRRFVDAVLSWMTKAFTAAAVAEAAHILIEALLKLL